MEIADRIYSLAKKQNDPALLIGAYGALANTLCYLGNFEAARQSAMSGVEIWRSGGVKFPVEEIVTPPVSCLIYEAYSEWFLGEIAACQANTAEAISLAKELKDMNALAVTLYLGGILAFYQRNPVAVERLASELIELSARYNFAFWLPGANVLRGWAHSVCGDTSEGISWIERGVEDYRASGSMVGMPLWLAVKSEALCLADRSAEALQAIGEAEAIAERFEIGSWYAELKRLRGVSLAALGGDETRIEASFRAAIKIAREQKAVSLEKRAEALRRIPRTEESFGTANLEYGAICDGTKDRGDPEFCHIPVGYPADRFRSATVNACLSMNVVEAKRRGQPHFHKVACLDCRGVEIRDCMLNRTLRLSQRVLDGRILTKGNENEALDAGASCSIRLLLFCDSDGFTERGFNLGLVSAKSGEEHTAEPVQFGVPRPKFKPSGL